MDAVTFVRDYARMCKSYNSCGDCPLRGGCMGCPTEECDMDNIYRVIKTVDEWSKVHPIKTRLTDLLEKYPDAPMDENGAPIFCVKNLGYEINCSIGDCSNCMKCWDIPLEE